MARRVCEPQLLNSGWTSQLWSPYRHSCLLAWETWQQLERNSLLGGNASLFLLMLKKIMPDHSIFRHWKAFVRPLMWSLSQQRLLYCSLLHMICFFVDMQFYLGDEIMKRQSLILMSLILFRGRFAFFLSFPSPFISPIYVDLLRIFEEKR